jgi:hypothetical protein
MPPSPLGEGLGMRFYQNKFRINVKIREISGKALEAFNKTKFW